MKAKEITIYDTYSRFEREDETREWLFELCAEEEGWESPDDIPETRVFNEISFQNDIDWRELENELESIFEEDYYLMTGYCGTWRGKISCGCFIHSLRDFLKAIEHLDDVRIIDRSGHLIVEGSHHDGSDKYELKRLTHKGYLLADSNYFARDKDLHETIMNNNFYSALPHFAKRVYGV